MKELRIIELGQLVWHNLSDDERDFHRHNGTLDFTVGIIELLGLSDMLEEGNEEKICLMTSLITR